MAKAGKKVKFETSEQLQKSIDDYFDSLYRPVIISDKKTGQRCVLVDDATGKQVREQFLPATVTGLARALGMTREGLAAYRKKSDQFAQIIDDARTRVQEYAETRLYDKEGQKGAEFSLRVNFGWVPADTERELQLKERTVKIQEAKLNGISEDLSEINRGIQSLAQLINNPVPDREVSDFEK